MGGLEEGAALWFGEQWMKMLDGIDKWSMCPGGAAVAPEW